MAESRRGITLLTNLALSVASLLLFVLLSEALLTLWHPATGGVGPGIADPITGFRLRPHHTWREVGGAMARTNALGFRDEEHAPLPPPGGLRIVCLGDSSTFGYGVSPAQTYPARLERLLSGRYPGASVEVINAGVPGWASANGAAELAREAMRWKPGLVLVSFGYNEQLGSGPEAFHYDYDPATRRVLIHRLGEVTRRPIVVPPEEPPGAEPGRFDDLPRNLRLYRLTKIVLDEAQRAPERVAGAFKSSTLASWLLARVYANDPERIHRRLRVEVASNHVLAAYEDSLEAIIRMVRAGGAQPVILLQPRRAYREFLEWLPPDERARNLRAVALIRAGKPDAALAILEPLWKEDPSALITAFNLSVAYRKLSRGADADRVLDAVVSIRSFTMNVVADRVASRLGVPVVYTPLAFEASDDPDLFFPDRYHTRSAGYAIVAKEVEKTLVQEGVLENVARGPSGRAPAR